MKLNLLLSVFCLTCLSSFARAQGSLEETITHLVKECQESEGGSNSDTELLLSGKGIPESNEGKCMIMCTQEKMGVVSWKLIENRTFF